MGCEMFSEQTKKAMLEITSRDWLSTYKFEKKIKIISLEFRWPGIFSSIKEAALCAWRCQQEWRTSTTSRRNAKLNI